MPLYKWSHPGLTREKGRGKEGEGLRNEKEKRRVNEEEMKEKGRGKEGVRENCLKNDKLYIFEKPLTMPFQICKKFCKSLYNLMCY